MIFRALFFIIFISIASALASYGPTPSLSLPFFFFFLCAQSCHLCAARLLHHRPRSNVNQSLAFSIFFFSLYECSSPYTHRHIKARSILDRARSLIRSLFWFPFLFPLPLYNTGLVFGRDYYSLSANISSLSIRVHHPPTPLCNRRLRHTSTLSRAEEPARVTIRSLRDYC